MNLDKNNNSFIDIGDAQILYKESGLTTPNTITKGIAEYLIKDEYDFIIIGGGAGGTIAAYQISESKPNASILIIEKNEYTFQEYKNKGYENLNTWSVAQNDISFNYAYSSLDGKDIWMGKGIGGGTLHFGLQYIDNIDKNYLDWKDKYYSTINSIVQPQLYDYNSNDFNYSWKDLSGVLNSSNNMNTFNNKIYRTSDNKRLLLGNLIENKSNINIQYGESIKKLTFSFGKVDTIISFSGKIYKGNQVILSSGAIQTPAILQRSGIDCGNKLYDHGALVGMLYNLKSNTNTFEYSSHNLSIINKKTQENGNGNEKYIYSVKNGPGNGKILDFTSWVNSHNGGSNNITKWKTANVQGKGNEAFELIYPHYDSRWFQYQSNFTEIGEKGVKYTQLHSSLDNIVNISDVTIFDLSQNSIIGHLQTRDDDLKWQTYYSTVPNLNFLILTFSQSTNLSGEGKVKIASMEEDLVPDVSLNHITSDEMAQDIVNAFNENNNILVNDGFSRANFTSDPLPNINIDYVKNNVNSIYHYHGSCAIGDVVDVSCQVFNIQNLYIGDASVLPEPWGGSTSFPAMIAGHIASQTALYNEYSSI